MIKKKRLKELRYKHICPYCEDKRISIKDTDFKHCHCFCTCVSCEEKFMPEEESEDICDECQRIERYY